MYDVNNDLAPKNITDLFTQIATVHSYGTRASTAGNYQIKYSRTTLQKNAVSRVGLELELSANMLLVCIQKHLLRSTKENAS
jgi:hypothetical protein